MMKRSHERRRLVARTCHCLRMDSKAFLVANQVVTGSRKCDGRGKDTGGACLVGLSAGELDVPVRRKINPIAGGQIGETSPLAAFEVTVVVEVAVTLLVSRDANATE